MAYYSEMCIKVDWIKKKGALTVVKKITAYRGTTTHQSPGRTGYFLLTLISTDSQGSPPLVLRLVNI